MMNDFDLNLQKEKYWQEILSSKDKARYPKPDDKLWRYMDFTFFLSMLDTSTLYFNRLDHYSDKFEGAFVSMNNKNEWDAIFHDRIRKCFIAGIGECKIENYPGKSLDEAVHCHCDKLKKTYSEIKRRTFINCWHCNEVESDAMWKLYLHDNKGIAIQSTFDKLFHSLPLCPHKDFGFVKYRNLTDPLSEWKWDDCLNAVWYKQKSFEHEKEFRIVIRDEFKGIREWEKIEPVNLHTLIEKIYISPQAENWFYSLVQSIVNKRYGLDIDICHSSLNELPYL